MNMLSTEGIAEVDQSRVNHDVLLATIEQFLQITKMSVTASNAIPGTVLVQDIHLPRGEPTLNKNKRLTPQGRITKNHYQ